MTLEEALVSVWRRVLADGRASVELEGKSYPVTILRAKKLRMAEFAFGPYRIAGIEQNPRTSSCWAALAQQGKRIMQFRCMGRYVANVCDGKLLHYPAWRAVELPE